MATAVQITYCAPAAAAGAIFYKPTYRTKKLPVHLTEENDEGTFECGLSFDDYSHCHTYSHVGGERDRFLTAPDWTQNDASVRSVLLFYLEKRVFSKKQCARFRGNERFRYIRVMRKLNDSRETLLARSERLCEEYRAHAECTAPFCIARRRVLRKEIKSIGGQVFVCSRPDVFHGIIIDFFRARLMAPEIAEKYVISHDAVRQIIFRLNQAARSLGYDVPSRPRSTPEQIRMRKEFTATHKAACTQRKAERAAAREARRAERMRLAAEVDARRASRQNQKLLQRAAHFADKFEQRKACLAICSTTKQRPRHNDGTSTRARWVRDGFCRACGGKYGVRVENRKYCAYCLKRALMWNANRKRKAKAS